jgi:hypothetical protein
MSLVQPSSRSIRSWVGGSWWASSISITARRQSSAPVVGQSVTTSTPLSR